MVIIVGIILALIICFIMDNWIPMVVIVVLSIIAVAIHNSIQKSSSLPDKTSQGVSPMNDFEPKHIERQRKVFKKYGFDLMPGETMSPETAEWVLRNEREWRNEQQKKKLLSLQKKINFNSISGTEFEELCAKLFEIKGYDATLTKKSGDHGGDIIIKRNGISYAVQCKCYSSPVGFDAVKEAYAAKGIYHTDKAAVLTNSTFTKQAIEDAKKLSVELWDYDVLGKLISNIGDFE